MDEIVECCASCVYGAEYYGYEWFCHNRQLNRSKRHPEYARTEPYKRCDDFEFEDGLL